jgi:hypothetical protein
VDLTTGASKILVVVESLPEVEQRLDSGLGTGIEKNADFRVQDTTKSVKEPSVRVNLLAVLLLETEHHLHRGKSAGAIVCGPDELLVRSDGKLGRVLELLCVSGQTPGKKNVNN